MYRGILMTRCYLPVKPLTLWQCYESFYIRRSNFKPQRFLKELTMQITVQTYFIRVHPVLHSLCYIKVLIKYQIFLIAKIHNILQLMSSQYSKTGIVYALQDIYLQEVPGPSYLCDKELMMYHKAHNCLALDKVYVCPLSCGYGKSCFADC